MLRKRSDEPDGRMTPYRLFALFVVGFMFWCLIAAVVYAVWSLVHN